MESLRTTVKIEKRYFDINKFENLVFGKNRIKVKKLKNKKVWRVLDFLLAIIMFFVIGIFLFFSIRVFMSNILIAKQRKDITKLESILYDKRINNKKLNDEIANMVDKDYIKSNAYLNLSMFLPTDANVIFYEKTDNGYVRQIDEIR